MNNNTKIRLRLSKNLFESLTREILAEAKVNDGYSVAVKQPKTPKQSKSQQPLPQGQIPVLVLFPSFPQLHLGIYSLQP